MPVMKAKSGGYKWGKTGKVFKTRKEAEEYDKRRSRYDQALVNMQEYRDQAFKLNELDPYKEKMAAMQQLKRDNRSMIFGGLGQAAGGLGNFGAATT